jgi:hypothetical protein
MALNSWEFILANTSSAEKKAIPSPAGGLPIDGQASLAWKSMVMPIIGN